MTNEMKQLRIGLQATITPPPTKSQTPAPTATYQLEAASATPASIPQGLMTGIKPGIVAVSVILIFTIVYLVLKRS